MNKIIWSEKQKAILSAPYSHCLEVNEGTPRSGKTTVSVSRFAWYLWNTPDKNHMVLAYNQEQAFKLVMDCDGFGLIHIFNGISSMRHDDFGDHLEIQTPNGIKRVYYKGAGKADSHKAFTGMSLGSVYFCEINLLHMDAIQEALRRTYAAKIRWHIADLNPPAPSHPVISDVFDVQDTKWMHWTIDDNPIISPERKEEIRLTCLKNPYLYKRDWLGERCVPQGVIYAMFDHQKHIVSAIPAAETKMEMYFAGDGGLSDATSIGCYVITRDTQNKFKLYRVAGWYYSGTDTGITKAMSVQAREICSGFIPYCREVTNMRESCIKIDPACKALRAELDLLGYYTDRADNNSRDIKGSSKGVDVGIEYLQSSISDGRFYLVENNRFGHADFIKEIGMYCVDNNGKPIDAYNHAMDETRYAHNYFYKNYVL